MSIGGKIIPEIPGVKYPDCLLREAHLLWPEPDLIAGVDVSSHILAIVYLEARTGALHSTLELRLKPGGKHPDMPRSPNFGIAGRDLSKARAVFIENGMGADKRSVSLMGRATGALINHIDPDVPVSLYGPSEWKKAVGLKGNADKEAIRAHARVLYPELDALCSQDICDAACIARAGFNESSTAAILAEGA